MEKILISACLVGENTRYDGKNNYLPIVEKLKEKYELIPFCPEVMGGLLTPREPCEIQGPDVKTKDGVSKVKEYNLGAKKALEACRLFGIRIAILAESSPSCGVRNIYDGHFNQTKIPGKGITTRLLEENGIACYSSLDDLSFLFTDPEKKEKEYLSYEERDYQLRHPMKKRRFGDRKPRFVKKDEEKPGEEKISSNEGEKKEFTKKEGFHKDFRKSRFGGKSFSRGPRKEGSFHHDHEKRYDHHDQNEEGKERKPYFKKKDSFHDHKDGKSFSKKRSFHGNDEKRSYGKKDFHKGDSFHKGGSFHKDGSFHKGGKSFSKGRSFQKGSKKD